MNSRLNLWIALAALAGVGIGFMMGDGPASQVVLYFSDILGKVFIGLLRMILIPLVFTSITLGVTRLGAHGQMSRVWKLTTIYFLSTSALAILLGLIIVNTFQPGVGLTLELLQQGEPSIARLGIADFFRHFMTHLIKNPIQAMAKGEILPLIVFAIFVGAGLIRLRDKAGQLQKLFEETFELILKLTGWVMNVAPLGVCALLIQLVASQHLSLFKELALFAFLVLSATLIHGLFTLPTLAFVFANERPSSFFRGIQEALLTALSTSSSSATLPITMECMEERFHVDKAISGFVLPIGATMNMDGTALYEAIAAVFVANIVGVDMSLGQQLILFLVTMLAAIGAPGIPSAGMVTMVLVLETLGLPAEAIAILLPIDRLLDTVRTAVNVEGDAVGCLILARTIQKP